jgi:hypothetical protein
MAEWGNKQMDIQKESNYYDLLLPETSVTYLNFMLKEIMRNPENMVLFSRSRIAMILPTRKIEVDSTISDLADF